MSTTTIQIPADHVEAVRQGLLGRRADPAHSDEIDGLLRQLEAGVAEGARSHELTGPRTLLWNAVYDSLCAAAEQLADDCNEYWRGEIAPDSARTAIAVVGARFDLLVGLGAPPGS